MQFKGRAAEVSKQYEVNNNAELDNGVYHEFSVSDSKQPRGRPVSSGVHKSVQKTLDRVTSQADDAYKLTETPVEISKT